MLQADDELVKCMDWSERMNGNYLLEFRFVLLRKLAVAVVASLFC
jgi:hypothetical protein